MILLPILLTLVLAADYYKVLGVSRDATDRELKKAYRMLSKQHHPDKNRGDEASAQKFIEIAEAYEILSDPEKRNLFDRYGEAGVKGHGQGQGGFNMHQDPMDLFQHFFGGGAHFQQQRQGPDKLVHVEATLKSMYNLEKLEVSVPMSTICDECDGTGSSDGRTVKCDECGGQGQRIVRHQIAPGMFQQMQTVCDKCQGRGKTFKQPCKVCHGERVVEEERKFNIFIEPHSEMVWDHILEGEGDQSPDVNAGNLVMRIVQSKNENYGYRRRGFNLFRTEAINAKEAQAGGWSRKLLRLDLTTEIELKRAKGKRVYNGEIEKFEGEGMPRTDDGDIHGDLYVRYVVVGDVSRMERHDEL